MKRRAFLIQGAAALALSSPAIAAQDYVEVMVAQLRAQGYTDISVKWTLLGRAQIAASKAGKKREIILNPRTGEILRDLRLDDKGRVRLSDDEETFGSDDDRSGSDRRGDDDDDGEGGSDNSGSGNSGSGNSGSGSGSGGDDGDDE